MLDLMSDLYRQNEWANLTLIEACRSLSEEQLDATAEGTFGSIRDTLVHIVRAEGGYATSLGHEPSPRLERGDPWPGLDALAEMASAAAESLIAAAVDAPVGMLRVGSETQRFDVDPAVILVQAFHHSTEHRSQINTVFTAIGVEPLELSSWDWGLAVDRMRRV